MNIRHETPTSKTSNMSKSEFCSFKDKGRNVNKAPFLRLKYAAYVNLRLSQNNREPPLEAKTEEGVTAAQLWRRGRA